jgi:hypothetical protein
MVSTWQSRKARCASLLNEPELLILEEPFTGLDPVSMRLLRAIFIKEQKRGATILFSTHKMAEAEMLCDNFIMIYQRRKVLDQSIAEILGQFVVGLTVLLIYLGLGLVALMSLAMLMLIDMGIIFYLFLFYLISFFTYASLMAAVGASVNDIREAQSLMMPIMLTLMLPMFLGLPVSLNPASSLALALSMIPPVNSFFMLMRMASSTPPSLWQVWTSIGLGLAGAYAAVWSAA